MKNVLFFCFACFCMVTAGAQSDRWAGIDEMFGKRSPPRPTFAIGRKSPSFSETDIRGKRYSLKKMRGKVVVLSFTFINRMPYYQQILPLNELVDSYKDNEDVVFIAVAPDTKKSIENFLTTTPFNYNIIYEGWSIISKFGITFFPTHIVLDMAGKVIFYTSGLLGGDSFVPLIRKAIEKGLKPWTPKE